MTRAHAYDISPRHVVGAADDGVSGADAIATRLAGAGPIAIECYPGLVMDRLRPVLDALRPDHVIDSACIFRPADEIEALTAADLTSDPVFGRITRLQLTDFIDADRLGRAREQLVNSAGRVCVTGPGATLITAAAPATTVVYATLPRWEAVLHQRRQETANLGLNNRAEAAGEKYRRAYFIDWRVGDRHRRDLWPRIDWLLDTCQDEPLMVAAPVMWKALESLTRRPFRFVPTFDPAPWGGTWLQRVCATGGDKPNLGWCFDCVPEENSLLLGFGRHTYQMPGIELVLREPRALLGESVYGRFGAEFPIRTDFLDTIGGGNLSLQVHPLTDYIRDHFSMAYTQDESYYVLAAEADGAVHLGVVDGVDPVALEADLRHSESTAASFPVEKHVNRFPARAHDHFLIPAGTIHGSARGTMVLEISATPYIFTFKLHDWNRDGLDGRPRPLHIGRGLANLRADRDTAYARDHLINAVTPIASGDGWCEERTGLHEAEFIETRRHWFSVPVVHPATGRFSVITVVAGDGVVIESPQDAFEPYTVSYAETCVVPAAAGAVRIRPFTPAQRCATIKAFVRTAP